KGTHAIQLQKADLCNVNDNIITDMLATGNGVRLSDVKDSNIQGNVVSYASLSTGRGVNATSCTDLQINGNRVKGGNMGVSLDDACTYCTVMSNNVRECNTPLSMGTGTGHKYQTAAGDN